MANPPRKQRGAIARKRRIEATAAPPPEVIVAEREALIARYVAESPVVSPAGKQAMAEQLATLVVLQRELARRLALGALTAEEVRTIPGVASNARRIAESLGVVIQDDDEGDLEV